MPKPSREPIIDNLKALGILLVVVGHAPGIPAHLIALIYSFHMPLFFFLSGYLLNGDRLRQQSWSNWILRSFKTLLIPWMVFYLISWGYQIVATLSKHLSPVLLLSAIPIRDFLIGTSVSMAVNIVLWFFPALFLTSAVFRCLHRQLLGTYIWLITTTLALIWLYVSPRFAARWLWSADCVPIALCFYSFGYAIATHGKQAERLLVLHKHPLWGAAWLVGLLVLVAINGRVDLNGLSWGEQPLLYLPTACWGIAGLWWCAAHIPATKYATWLARNSLIIFPLHPLFFSGMTGLGMLIFQLPEGFQYSSLFIGPVYTILALLLSYPASFLLRPLFSR